MPVGNTLVGQLAAQDLQHHLKLGSHDLGMTLHQLQGMLLILQILHMTQLVDLIVGNGLNTDVLQMILDILLGGCQHGNTGTGEGDLGGGSKLIDHVGSAGFGTQGDNIPERLKLAVKLVDAVSVVPHDGKIGSRRLQIGKTIHGFVGVGVALGIGIFGHAPNTLDQRILHQLLHHIHIGAKGGHGHGDQLIAKILGDAEMAVVSGAGAQELDTLLLAPGTLAVLEAIGMSPGDQIVHEAQAGVATNEGLLNLTAKHIGPVFPAQLQTCQITVVSGIIAVNHAFGGVSEDRQHVADQIQLQLAGLAAGHIQLQSLISQIAEPGDQLLCFDTKFFSASASIGGHFHHPSVKN